MKCKRLLVRTFAIKGNQVAYAENHNEKEGCTNEAGKCGCTHAEINLLKKLPNPSYVLVSHSPCLECAKALVAANVKRVRYVKEYRLTEGIHYLQEHGIDVRQIWVDHEFWERNYVLLGGEIV